MMAAAGSFIPQYFFKQLLCLHQRYTIFQSSQVPRAKTPHNVFAIVVKFGLAMSYKLKSNAPLCKLSIKIDNYVVYPGVRLTTISSLT